MLLIAHREVLADLVASLPGFGKTSIMVRSFA
jgi:hypothetical protein